MQSLLLPVASSSGVSAVALRPGLQHSCHQRFSTPYLPSFNPLLLAPKRKVTISSYQSPPSLPLYGFQIGGSKPSFTPSTVAFSSPTSHSSVSGDNEVDKAKLAQLRSRWSGPFKIKSVTPYRVLELWGNSGERFKVNGQRLNPYISSEIVGGWEIIELEDPPDLLEESQDH